MTYFYAPCAVCVTIFSTGGFSARFQLHAPTQVQRFMRSCHSWFGTMCTCQQLTHEWLAKSRSSYLKIWHVDFLLFLLLLPHQLQLKACVIIQVTFRVKLSLCHRSQQLHRAWLVNRTSLRLALFLGTAQLSIACSMEKRGRAWYFCKGKS